MAHKEFGFIAALAQVSREIGLVELLQKSFPGERYGVPRWLYFFITIINRLQHATSKEQMGSWAQKTILPELYEFDASALNSQSFWYATEDVISESDLRVIRDAKDLLSTALTTGISIKDSDRDAATAVLTGLVGQDKLDAANKLLTAGISVDNQKAAREAKAALADDLLVGVDESVFHNIVLSLFGKIKSRFGISDATTLYDTTNFFTYIDAPASSALARTGHNKDSRHHLRQVGLALAADKIHGIPFFYRVYRGNSHDSKTFGAVVDTLIEKIKATFPDVDDLVLVLDKGNNSKENFQHLTGKVKWVGSLVPSQYPALVKHDLADYGEQYQDILYFATQKKIMDVDCLVVSTYRPSLARKQLYTIYDGLVKLTNEIQEKFDAYKIRPTSIPTGITSLLKESRYGRFLELAVSDEQLIYALKLADSEEEPPSLAKKQAHHIDGLSKLTSRIQAKFDAYKIRPNSVPAGVKIMLEKNRYGKFLQLAVHDGLTYALEQAVNGESEKEPLTTELEKAKQRLGRNLLFTDNVSAGATWLIDNYQAKYKIEDCFSLMKSADLIRFRPIRHFTDTKICAFAFCCVVAVMLIKVLQLICAESELAMSPALIKAELTDIKAVTMIYGPNDVGVEITKRSTVQQKMWELFRLEEVASLLA
ncbi:MAG: IS1634 family transposase [Ktedonobacteraceae bacterium]